MFDVHFNILLFSIINSPTHLFIIYNLLNIVLLKLFADRICISATFCRRCELTV